MLRLVHALPSPGNVHIVNRFGHRRFKHARVEGKVVVDVVPSRLLRRHAAILPDMWHAKSELGERAKITAALSARGTLSEEMKYFEFRTVQFSSAPMVSVCSDSMPAELSVSMRPTVRERAENGASQSPSDVDDTGNDDGSDEPEPQTLQFGYCDSCEDDDVDGDESEANLSD